mgnify:FL=1
MKEEDFIEKTKEILTDNSKKIVLNQINRFYKASNIACPQHMYKIGDKVFLKKGTLLHGTYKNLEGLKEIVKNGLISSWFIDGRLSKYPSSVGVWNLQKDYYLKDYINFYSGGTIMYCGVFDELTNKEVSKTAVISYDNMSNINEISQKYDCHMWLMEQTKEARFMPSLNQDKVQIGIIFNADLVKESNLLIGDILDTNNFDDELVKDFVNPNYYEKFIKDRAKKDDFFTNRESAVLFGIPSNLIEGILVGKTYEKDKKVLKEIKEILPDCYICNLEGTVIF